MLIGYQTLEQGIARIFEAAGQSSEDAAWTAAALVRTSAKGVFSHGVHLVNNYVQRFRKFNVNFQAKMKLVADWPSSARIDGDNGVGQVIMRDATKLAIEKAKQTGSAVVTGTHMHHYGAGLVYADMAVAEGMMFTLYANSKAQVAPFGAKKPFYGTNPVTWGIPCGKYAPYILDMACSVGAGNKLAVWMHEEKQAPEGWGIDGDGQPTTDPRTILFDGALLPFGGVKGSGLAGMANFMAGNASGAENDLYKLYDPEVNNYGMIMQVVDISKLMDMDEYNARVERQIGELLSLPPVDPARPVLYAGYLEQQRLEKALAEGIEVRDSILDEIREAGRTVGVDADEALQLK